MLKDSPDQNIEALREELRLLLKEKAILYADNEQPIRLRDGKLSAWMFYSWTVSLTSRGIQLAALCLLDKLRGFRAPQIATFGYTGMPLLSAIVLLGEGRYTGISIRDERKIYGSCRQIEGPVDKRKSVVLVDDSLSSGTSMIKGVKALEEEGFEVEGGICLVHFPWRGGMERMQGLGYRVETLFDIWKDLEMPIPVYIPGYKRAVSEKEKWLDLRVEDGLHPAHAARRAAEIYLSQKMIPHPPHRLDQEYDARGGTFISFRYRETDHRLVRDGFWHFNPADADPCRDVILATIKTIHVSRGTLTLEELKKLKIGVTFFSPLEKISPGKLDFSRYGIVARSQAYETKLGGALPNTEVYTNEVEQYRHARVNNAKISPFEPHDLFRHDLTKCVEPGEYWLPYGFPENKLNQWPQDQTIGQILTRRAQEYLYSAAGKPLAGEPIPENLISDPVFAVSVTLFHKGIIGCGVTWGDTLDACIGKAAKYAYQDKRFAQKRKGIAVEEISLSVSILHDREWLGEVSEQKAARKMRRGLDSLSVQKGNLKGFFLPYVPVYYNWTKEQVVKQLMKKAGIAQGPCVWSTYKTESWLRRGNRVWKLLNGFPDRSGEGFTRENLREQIFLLGNYINLHSMASGFPTYLNLPVQGFIKKKGTSARILHALEVLEIAGRMMQEPSWRKTAVNGLLSCLQYLKVEKGEARLSLPGQPAAPMADCVLLTALANSEDSQLHQGYFQNLVVRIKNFFQDDGRISYAPKARGFETDHDFFTGSAILALASSVKATGEIGDLKGLKTQFDWFKRRFRALHPWGMVGWHPQGWGAVYSILKEPQYADFVFEIADWALDWQQEKSGAFLIELHPYGPSFHTLFIAEGIAAAWRVAQLVGDRSRQSKYEASCQSAMRFLSQLMIYPQDTFCMPQPHLAVGGVRGCLSTSEVRIDYVSHSLLAAVKCFELTSGLL
jgi:orotate phosphoribosyltransferase